MLTSEKAETQTRTKERSKGRAKLLPNKILTKCKSGQISTSSTSSGVKTGVSNDCVQEKESRWPASAEGDVEVGDAEGAARVEEWPGWGGGTEGVELAGDEGEARNGCAARGESANSDVVR